MDTRKYVKLKEPYFLEFVTEAKKAFAIREQTPVKVTDDTSTEVDVDVFPELVAERGMCFSLHTNDDSTSAHELSPLLTDGNSVSNLQPLLNAMKATKHLHSLSKDPGWMIPSLQKRLSCRSLEDHLSEVEDRQPYLLATGQTKADVLKFYIVVDKNLIPCPEP
ncbi:hypothetical protein PO909_003889 [Leuciscus waleckii]